MSNLQTYFSHSYREADQEINKRYWELFGAEGFKFAVDPPSENFVSPHLERMMNRSSCFVAVINYREEETEFFCSRFILYEFGMALQAHRPFLLMVDNRINNDIIAEVDDLYIVRFYEREPLENLDEIKFKINELKKRVLNIQHNQRGHVGLLTDGSTSGLADKKRTERIEALCRANGFHLKLIELPFVHNTSMVSTLSKSEFVLVDVRGENVPKWAFAYIFGRLIPSLKLVRLAQSESYSEVELPPMVNGLKIANDNTSIESVIYWRDDDDLLHEIAQTLKKLKADEVQFRGLEDGIRYFDSIGRRRAKVFISSASSQIELALEIAKELALSNIEHFQYKAEGAMETGSDWTKQITLELETSNIFIALLDQEYFDSEWCQAELAIARHRGTYDAILPYQLGDTNVGQLGKIQVKDLRNYSLPERHRLIFQEIDKELRKSEDESSAPNEVLDSESKKTIVDLIRRLEPDQLKKVLSALSKFGVDVKLEGHSREEAEKLLWKLRHTGTGDEDNSLGAFDQFLHTIAEGGDNTTKKEIVAVKKKIDGFK